MKASFAYNWPALLAVVVFLAIWEGVMRIGWVSIIYIAAPSGIAKAFWQFVSTGEIWEHTYVSFMRFAVGLCIGFGIGITAGVLTGWFKPIRRSFQPLINALYGAPKIAILPLLVIWLGIGEASKITLIAFTGFFPLWLNTHAGIQNLDRLLIRVARNFGANEIQLLLKVGLPSILPYIASGFRLGTGHCLVMIVAAEMIAAQSGLGYLINETGMAYQLEELLSLIFLFGILCFLLLRTITFVEQKMVPWRVQQAK